MSKMNPEIKKKWLAMLRSGDFKQGKGVLRNGKDEYCCLGVLCTLYGAETGTEWGRDWMGDSDETRDRTMEGEQYYLPEKVREWAGLDHEYGYSNGLSLGVKDHVSLPVMNDTGKTFEEIAAVIEEKL